MAYDFKHTGYPRGGGRVNCTYTTSQVSAGTGQSLAIISASNMGASGVVSFSDAGLADLKLGAGSVVNLSIPIQCQNFTIGHSNISVVYAVVQG